MIGWPGPTFDLRYKFRDAKLTAAENIDDRGVAATAHADCEPALRF
jgi:hypothetical protein